MEEEGCMEYMRTLLRDSELFRAYVTVRGAGKGWCAVPVCDTGVGLTPVCHSGLRSTSSAAA